MTVQLKTTSFTIITVTNSITTTIITTYSTSTSNAANIVVGILMIINVVATAIPRSCKQGIPPKSRCKETVGVLEPERLEFTEAVKEEIVALQSVSAVRAKIKPPIWNNHSQFFMPATRDRKRETITQASNQQITEYI